MSKFQDSSDIELLREICKFNSRAIEELYNRYSPLFYTLIKKIAPDEKTAEIILVDVFAIIWRKAHQFDFEKGNAYVWLISLARNRAIDNVRRSRGSDGALDYYDDEFENFYIIPFLDENIDDLDLEAAKYIKPKIERALQKLSDAQKYVIHLAYYEGYTLNEIAKRLNIPVETVRGKITTALTNLKDFLFAERGSNG